MAEGELTGGGVSDGRGVVRTVGNGEGDPFGGTGVGGGADVAHAGWGARPSCCGMTASDSAVATTKAPDRTLGRRILAFGSGTLEVLAQVGAKQRLLELS